MLHSKEIKVAKVATFFKHFAVCNVTVFIDTFCVLYRAVPKFMKRIKVRDYKDRSVFGVHCRW